MLNQDLFDSLKAQKIVDTLMKGQKDYVDERLEKRETMKVSNGYAWTRPNHIDTAFASADLFEYKLQLAGQTWGYLEFETNTEKYGKVLLIIKGKKRLTSQFPLVQKNKSGYLFEYARMNTLYLNQHSSYKNDEDSHSFPIQMELVSDEMIQEIEQATKNSNIEKFMILTYEADSENNIISVDVVMPDARTGQLHLIQDLSEYIQSSSYHFEEAKYQDIPNFSELSETEDFEIIPRIEKQEAQK